MRQAYDYWQDQPGRWHRTHNIKAFSSLHLFHSLGISRTRRAVYSASNAGTEPICASTTGTRRWLAVINLYYWSTPLTRHDQPLLLEPSGSSTPALSDSALHIPRSFVRTCMGNICCTAGRELSGPPFNIHIHHIYVLPHDDMLPSASQYIAHMSFVYIHAFPSTALSKLASSHESNI